MPYLPTHASVRTPANVSFPPLPASGLRRGIQSTKRTDVLRARCQVLLSVDVAAAVCVLGGAVAGWDAVETDLREAATGRRVEEQLDGVLVATQVCVSVRVWVNGCARLVSAFWLRSARVLWVAPAHWDVWGNGRLPCGHVIPF